MRIGHKLVFFPHGNTVLPYFPKKFVEEFVIKKGDILLPCTQISEKLVLTDPVFGKQKEMIFKFRRGTTGKVYDTWNETYGDDIE